MLRVCWRRMAGTVSDVATVRKYQDGRYAHLNWHVSVTGEEITFDAGEDGFMFEAPGDGEFTLTLAKSELRELLGV